MKTLPVKIFPVLFRLAPAVLPLAGRRYWALELGGE